jgi:tripartite-type tricarboxylate transporter receptor subunit TctC
VVLTRGGNRSPFNWTNKDEPMISRRTISSLLAGLLSSLMLLSASAQGFPNKMVTVMVPYPAGGPSDAVARLVQVEY